MARRKPGSPKNPFRTTRAGASAHSSGEEVVSSQALLAGILRAARSQSIIATDPDGLITLFNSGAETMLAYREPEMLGTSIRRLHDPAEIEERAGELDMACGFQVVVATLEEPEGRPWSYLARSGARVIVSITASGVRDRSGVLTGYIMIGTDLSKQRVIESALKESEQRFLVMFESAPGGMMLLALTADNPGRFLRVNSSICALTGYSELELLGMSVKDVTHPDDRARHDERFASLLAGHSPGDQVERHWQDANGHDLWVQFSLRLIRSEGDVYLVGQVEDVTARRLAEDRLTHLAFHDELTGLPNRTLFTDRLEHAVSGTARSGGHAGVLVIALDGFKAVNDAAGHSSGDEVLVEVAARLAQAVRPGDTVARVGGDEFAVLCADVDSESIQTVAERTQQALNAPHLLAAGSFTISASVGVAVSTEYTRGGELLRDADAAVHRAKQMGRGAIRLSHLEDHAHSARVAQRLRLEGELWLAVQRDEFVLYGQPVVDLTSGAVVAVETLLRWQHPERGLLGPSEFLEIAESSPLMLTIGRWVLDESCRMAATWSGLLARYAIPVHVNVSARQLESRHLSTDIVAALNCFGLPGSLLVLELTETQMPPIGNSLCEDLEALRGWGVRLAIDDVGTGYSSLSRITELPVDMLKIDVSFVSGLGHDRACDAVVRAILGIGRSVGLSVVAEGVETRSQAELLHQLGCNTAQGYFYSRPLPESDLLSYLQAACAPTSAPLLSSHS